MLNRYHKRPSRNHPVRVTLFSLLFLFIIGSAAFLTYNVFFKGENFDLLINDAAKRHALDPGLVRALIWKESRFKPYARGKAGEIGLMQIRLPAVKDWAEANNMNLPCEGLLFNAGLNLEIGAWYLARAVNYWKSQGYKDYLELALCEYNAGRSATRKWLPKNISERMLDRIKTSSTKVYVREIMERYRALSRRPNA